LEISTAERQRGGWALETQGLRVKQRRTRALQSGHDYLKRQGSSCGSENSRRRSVIRRKSSTALCAQVYIVNAGVFAKSHTKQGTTEAPVVRF
jgi:hypothetical protein